MNPVVTRKDKLSDVDAQQSPLSAQENADFERFELARVGALLPGIVHNLSTPLSGVLGGIQMLEMRSLNIAESIEKPNRPTEAQWKELVSHLARNQKTIELASRNAQNLAVLLQDVANRIAHFSMKAPDIYSLNQLVQIEMRFLESDLTFKHRVRRSVHLADDLSPLKCVFSLFAETFDEIVYAVMTCHEPSQSVLPEMVFTTATESELLVLKIECNTPMSRFEEDTSIPISVFSSQPSLHRYFERLRHDGWQAGMQPSDLGTVFVLRHAPVVVASQR